jgi:predicted MFS family arabinose efflux permease
VPLTRSAKPATTSLPVCGLLVLAAAAFTDVVTDLLPAGVLPQMAGGLHVPAARIGLLVSAFAAASGLAAIPVTTALRRLPRRPVLIGVLTGFALADAVTAFCSAYPLVFGSRLLAGTMGGALWSMLAGYAARMVPAQRRGRAIAIVLAGITVALSAGIPAGTALATALGWRAGFAALAALALLLVPCVRWQVPAIPGEAAADRPSLRRVASLPGIGTVLVVTLLVLAGHQQMYTYVTLLARRSGFGDAGLVLLVFGVCTVGGIGLAGAVADRHLRSAILLALAVIAGAMLVLGADPRGRLAMLTAAALWGTAFGGTPALLQTALIGASGPSGADAATSMQTTVYNAGIAAGSLTGGLILDSLGINALPWATSLLIVVALTIAAAARHAFPAVSHHTAGHLAARPGGQGGASSELRL